MKRKFPSTICPTCGKEIRLKASGGDWLNALYPIRHMDHTGRECPGSFCEVETKNIIEPHYETRGRK